MYMGNVFSDMRCRVEWYLLGKLSWVLQLFSSRVGQVVWGSPKYFKVR